MKKKPAITKPATSSVLTLHAFFSKLPLAGVGADFAIAARTRPGQSAYASLLGLIPGDESDEEFIHALEELSPDAVKALDAALAKIA